MGTSKRPMGGAIGRRWADPKLVGSCVVVVCDKGPEAVDIGSFISAVGGPASVTNPEVAGWSIWSCRRIQDKRLSSSMDPIYSSATKSVISGDQPISRDVRNALGHFPKVFPLFSLHSFACGQRQLLSYKFSLIQFKVNLNRNLNYRDGFFPAVCVRPIWWVPGKRPASLRDQVDREDVPVLTKSVRQFLLLHQFAQVAHPQLSCCTHSEIPS